MDALLNLVRREALRALATSAPLRLGTIADYDASSYSVKVTLQPDGQSTGWLPLASPWVGNGWGLFLAPAIGEQVIVDFQEANHEAGIAMLRLYDRRNRPLNVPSTEAWLVDARGSFIKLTVDGKLLLNGNTEIDMTAPTLHITTTGDANLVVGGNVNATITGNLIAQIGGALTATVTGIASLYASAINLGASAGDTLKKLVNDVFITLYNAHVHTNGNAGANTGAPTVLAGATHKTSTVSAE